MDRLGQVAGEPHCDRAGNTGALKVAACRRTKIANQRLGSYGPTLKEIAGAHSGHSSSNPPGLSMNATVRVRVVLLGRVLDHSSKTEGGLVAMIQLGG
jgi:hypothetical protein